MRRGPLDPIEALAEELLVERAFLDDIVELLEDKGQVIFYGPPGTGKTYLAQQARRGARARSDAARRSCSSTRRRPTRTSSRATGPRRPTTASMTYRLTPGPLALLAERGAEAARASGTS